jgi:hypothetical protein
MSNPPSFIIPVNRAKPKWPEHARKNSATRIADPYDGFVQLLGMEGDDPSVDGELARTLRALLDLLNSADVRLALYSGVFGR